MQGPLSSECPVYKWMARIGGAIYMGTQLEEKRQKRSHCLPFIFRNHVYRAVSNPFKSSNTFSSIHSADIDQASTELSTLRCAKEPGLPARTLQVSRGERRKRLLIIQSNKYNKERWCCSTAGSTHHLCALVRHRDVEAERERSRSILRLNPIRSERH